MGVLVTSKRPPGSHHALFRIDRGAVSPLRIAMKRIPKALLIVAALALIAAESPTVPGTSHAQQPPSATIPADDPADVKVLRNVLGPKRLVTDDNGNIGEIVADVSILSKYPELVATLARMRHVHRIHSAVNGDLLYLVSVVKGAWPTLLSIDIYGNISDNDLANLERMQDLTGLVIDSDKITDNAFDHIGKLKNLQYLCIHGLLINGPGLKELANLKDLTQLQLDHSPVNDEGLKHLKGMRLNTLTLSLTNITDRGLDEIRDMATLKLLDISYDKITDKAFDAIGKLKNLERLRVDHASINGTGFKQLAGLKNLTELQVGNNPINDEGLKYLKRLSLRILNLSHTEITDRGIDEIKDITTLKLLNVKDTNASLGKLEQIRGLNILRAKRP